jgi:hypothetical protein
MSGAKKTVRIPLMDEISDSITLLDSMAPRQVDGYALSPKSKLPWKVLLYRGALAWRMAELGRSAFESLASSKLVSGIVLTRAAVEVSVALWFLCAKITAVVDSQRVGDADDYLMKLSMGTATGWPEDSSPGTVTMPRPVRVGKLVDHAEKDIEGFKHYYGVLSEYAHPNWAGTVLLYSDTNRQTAMTSFGQNVREAESTKKIGVSNLSVALKMFHSRYNRISDLLPTFIGVCESNPSDAQST